MPPRARRPRGHVEPLPSGSFRAVVFTGIDPLTRRRQYIRETCPTRAEAEKALTRLQRQADEHKHPKSSITVATAVEQWMEVADLEVTTREQRDTPAARRVLHPRVKARPGAGQGDHLSHPGFGGGPDVRMILLADGRRGLDGCSEVPGRVAGSRGPAVA